MGSDPKYATSRWDSLSKTHRMATNHIFRMKNIKKKQQTPYFHASATTRERRRENMGFVVVFFNIMEIENNGFIAILGSGKRK